jgi:hypothetical protein
MPQRMTENEATSSAGIEHDDDVKERAKQSQEDNSLDFAHRDHGGPLVCVWSERSDWKSLPRLKASRAVVRNCAPAIRRIAEALSARPKRGVRHHARVGEPYCDLG